MTLLRQIAINLAVVFALLLIALIYNNFQQSSRFIQGQMQTAANDTATTLGITIANTIDPDDTAALETLFNTVFDSGYYSRIELISIDGKAIAEKERPILIRDVPEWFRNLVQVETATGTTQVMKGWLHFGELRLALHPGYAYAELYNAFTGMLFWFGLLGSISYLSIWFLLRWFMQPLHRMQQQAEAIHENRFIRQDKLPRTLELRQVVGAMNRMVDKVKTIFDEQADTLRRYHELLYVDDTTKLANRRYMLMRLKELLQDEASVSGTLALISLQGLETTVQRHGFQAAEAVIRSLAEVVVQKLPTGISTIVARMNEGDFTIYLDSDAADTEVYVNDVFTATRTLLNEQEIGVNAGLVKVCSQKNIAEILGQADLALTQARSRGNYQLHHHTEDGANVPLGKMQWRSWLTDSLTAQRFFLVGQAVTMPGEELLHRELFIRLRDEKDEVIPAGRFIPIAASLGMEANIDREVYRIILSRATSFGPVAINLSRSVLSSAEALADFEQFVRHYHERNLAPLYIEINHFALLQYAEVTHYIAKLIRANGYYFGIDNFDFGADLEAVREIRPHYIKIAARKLDDITSGTHLGAFQPLRTLASSLDIQLIAVGVDSEPLLQRLQQLGSLGLQGNHLQEPQVLS